MPIGTPVADLTLGGSLIAANSTTEVTFPLIPAPNGSAVHISPLGPLDASWNGLMWLAYISAANVVKVRFANCTAGGITPVAQGFKLKLFTDPSLG